MTTRRRDFLNWLGASGAFAAMVMPTIHVPGHDQHDVPVSDKWDMSWCDRITGKARAVFDSPEVSDGAAMFRAQVWRDQHKEVYGTTPAEMSAVIVFRHEGIPLVMNDAYWQRFEVGKSLKIRDAKGKKWSMVNPIGVAAPGATGNDATYNVRSFLDTGGIVLACNFAFGNMVEKFKDADKLSMDDARARAIEHRIPGVILQPSGFFAVLRAQQAGCNFLLAS
jgi:hypothetical protein